MSIEIPLPCVLALTPAEMLVCPEDPGSYGGSYKHAEKVPGEGPDKRVHTTPKKIWGSLPTLIFLSLTHICSAECMCISVASQHSTTLKKLG